MNNLYTQSQEMIGSDRISFFAYDPMILSRAARDLFSNRRKYSKHTLSNIIEIMDPGSQALLFNEYRTRDHIFSILDEKLQNPHNLRRLWSESFFMDQVISHLIAKGGKL